MTQLDNLKANKRMGGLDETTVDRPLTWNDLTFKCVPKQEGEEDSAEVTSLILTVSATSNHHLSVTSFLRPTSLSPSLQLSSSVFLLPLSQT